MANSFGKPFSFSFKCFIITSKAAYVFSIYLSQIQNIHLFLFQERVEAILLEDRELCKRIFDLREAAASLAGGQVSQGGGVQMFQLSQDIENLISRQRGLMQEKDDHERHIK